MSQDPLSLTQRVTKMDDERIREVTLTAHGYQKQHPDLAWGECVRLAEKHVSPVKF